MVCQGYWDLFKEKVSLKDLKDEELKKVKMRMAEARVLLILGVEDAQLAQMTDPNPYVIWENLGKVHHAHGFGSGLALCHVFITASMKKDQTMEAWIREVRSLANCLIAINVLTSNEDIIVVLTTGLPPSYETVIISLNAVASTKLTLNFVITCLLNEESHQNFACLIIKVESEEVKIDSEAIVAVKKTGINIICFYCGGTSHFSASCEVQQKHIKAIDGKFAGIAIFPNDEDDKVNYAF